ncbi:MAG TPA: hypothetical protein VKB88_43580 [Bryobacteraceae bacterium]|nr:hypothetical protein [Bryobacteraceae bacterium]
MQTQQLHDDDYLRVMWDDDTRVTSIDWKEATSAMTDEDFKTELELFAGLVERKKAQGILVDVAHFRHKMGPEVQEWRLKNISGRYFAAGVRRFAFLFPAGASVPPAMNESAPGENFVTRAFNDPKKAMTWLTESN